MKIKKVSKRFLLLLLVLTMLAGMLPLSAIFVNARVVNVDENRFRIAAELATKKVGSTSYAGNSANFVANMLNDDKTVYYDGFTWPGKLSTKNPNSRTLEEELVKAGAGTVSGRYQDYDILVGNNGSVGFVIGTTVYYSSGSVVSTTSYDVFSNPSNIYNWTGGIRATYRCIKNFSYEVDESVNLGDEFYAYINVVGNKYNYGKVLSVDTTKPLKGTNYNWTNLICVDTPNYTDAKQIWKFTRVKNDTSATYYYIQNMGNNGYINVYQGGNHNLCTTAGGTADNYKWMFIKKSSNAVGASVATYGLRPKCYDTEELHIFGTNNDDVRTVSINNSIGNSQFFIQKINTVKTDTVASIRCRLDLDNKKNKTCVGANDDGTDVCYKSYDILNPSVTSSITWRFERVGDSLPPIYNIKHEKTGKYLQVEKNNIEIDNISIGEKTTDSTDTSQQWILLGDNTDNLNFVSVYYTKRKYSYYRDSNGSGHYDLVVNRDTEVVLNMDTPHGDTSVDKNIQCGLNNFHDAQKFMVKYEAIAVDYGDFYSPMTLSVPKANEYYSIALSQDGKNSSFKDYDDPKDGGVKIRRISDTPAVDQQWYFKSLGDGTYAIQNLANGYYIYNTGSDLCAYKEFKDENKFKWYIAEEPENSTLPGVKYYSLRNKEDFSKAFEIYGATTNNGGSAINEDIKVTIQSANHSPAQGWVLDISKTSPAWGEDLGDTFWAYISPSDATNKYLQCASVYEGAKQLKFAEINDDLKKRKQENYWKFERNNDGSYKISSCCIESKIIDANGAFATGTSASRFLMLNGEKPYTDTYKTYNQRWFIRKYARGYVLESKMTGQVLTINADNSASAARVNENHTDQLFNIIKTDLTVPNDLLNVKMRLFNYGRAINSADGAILPFFNGSRNNTSYVDTDENTENYNMDDITPSMSKTLKGDDTNGYYPYVTDTHIDKSNDNSAKSKFTTKSGSLKYLFDDSNEFVQGKGSAKSYNLPSGSYKTDSNYQSQCFTVNNPSSLFKKNSSTGLYYYDSLLNAAYFLRDTDSSGNKLSTGNFNLFDYTMTVPNAGSPYKKDSNTVTGISSDNGNFYPFNIAHKEGDVSYGDLGSRQKIPTTNDYVTAGEYAPVNYSLNGTASIDCWFGMTIETEFEQTSDGTYDGKPVQFNFKGDDDVWVYIDGVLVLDVGGTHGAREGTINFQNGKVTYPKLDANYKSLNEYQSTTLKELYQAVVDENKKNNTTFTYKGITIDQSYVDNNFVQNEDGTYRFKADIKHTLNFYYMERGGVISYCKINFNLPKGTSSV